MLHSNVVSFKNGSLEIVSSKCRDASTGSQTRNVIFPKAGSLTTAFQKWVRFPLLNNIANSSFPKSDIFQNKLLLCICVTKMLTF